MRRAVASRRPLPRSAASCTATAPWRAGDLFHLLRLLLDHGRVPVRLHEQDGLGIQRQADLRIFLHALDRDPIEKLQRAGNDLRRDDRRDRFRRRVHLRESRQQRFFGRAVWARACSSTLVMIPSVPSEPMKTSFIE